VSNTIRYDSLLVLHLARELNAELAGAEPLALRMERAGQRVYLAFEGRVLAWDLGQGAVGWAEAGESGSEVALPRRAVVASVEAMPDERILTINFRGGKRQNAAHALVIELLPNASNAVALDERGLVLKSLTPRSGSRAQTRGQPYQAPEPLARLGVERPLELAEWNAGLVAADEDKCTEVLVQRVAYVSPINAAGVCERPEQSYERYLDLRQAETQPVILRSGQPYCHPLWQADAAAQPSLLQAIRTASEKEQGAVAAVERLEWMVSREQKKIERLQSELKSSAADALRLRAHADLLLASANDVKKGAQEIELTGFDGVPVRLTLDPARGAVDNARDWYDEARKRERAGERLPALIAQAEKAVAKLKDDLTRARAGETSDLPAAAAKPVPKQQQRGPRLPYRQYRTSGGLEVRVGRSSRENDELTMRHAAPNDIWLHARAVGGAHVVLRWSDADASPPKQDMTEAAILAAVHSRARHAGTVPVDWTRKKYVRKHRGAPAGQVTIERAKTLFVKPSAALEERLRWGDSA
jgi:predicted ribosome quality control (RQC) complex YloA/Tae2 family protein